MTDFQKHIPHLYRFDPIDANAPNVITQLFVCSQMQQPNAMDCVHDDRDVTMRRDSIVIEPHVYGPLLKQYVTVSNPRRRIHL